MVTLIGSLPTAGGTLLHPAPVFGGGWVPGPPRGPFGEPLPAWLGSVMKIQPVFAAGLEGDPTGLPPLGSGPFGHAGLLARSMITACPVIALATSVSVGQE